MLLDYSANTYAQQMRPKMIAMTERTVDAVPSRWAVFGASAALLFATTATHKHASVLLAVQSKTQSEWDCFWSLGPMQLAWTALDTIPTVREFESTRV